MYNDVLGLIGYSEAPDQYGIPRRTETKRLVFCQVKSIGQKEFYQASAVGLKPELKFVIADSFDYDDEKELEYNGKRYSVLRTYRTGNSIEITAYGLNV